MKSTKLWHRYNILKCSDFGIKPCIECTYIYIAHKYKITDKIQQYKTYIKDNDIEKHPEQMKDMIVSELLARNNPYVSYMHIAIKYYFPEYVSMYNKLAVLK